MSVVGKSGGPGFESVSEIDPPERGRHMPFYETSDRCASGSAGEVPRFVFDHLLRVPGLVHGVFSRHGGVSRPPFASLNVAWNIGDERDSVAENLNRIKASLGVGVLVASSQVHGDTIRIVDETVLAQAEDTGPVLVTPPCDALVTALCGVGLLIKIADCQAIFLVDPVRRVIAGVHSGWRGSVLDIASKTVRLMAERFGSRPGDLLAAVGPSLGPCCGEFRNYQSELPESFHSFQVRPFYFDFWAATRFRLVDMGLRAENIVAAERCTVCGTDDFFSYRGEGLTGRMAAVVAWGK